MTSTAAKARASGSRFARVRHWFGRFESPTTTYYLLLATTAILVVFGLIMVLSASAITSLTQSKSGSAFTIFRSQLLYAGIGTVGLLIASRIAVPLWKKLALPILGGALVLQLLVAFIGTTVNGNRNWLRFGPVSIQPSELVKFGLVLFGALALTAKRDKLGQIGHVVVPYLVPGAAIALALVLLGGDLGTSIILAAIIAATLWAAGVPLRWFLASALVFGVIASAFVISSPNRLPFRRVVGSGHRHVRGSTTAHARPLRPRRRWMVRARPVRLAREMAVAVRAAQRLHLRHHR